MDEPARDLGINSTFDLEARLEHVLGAGMAECDFAFQVLDLFGGVAQGWHECLLQGEEVQFAVILLET